MIKKILIANRGEIAVRISRAAADMNVETVGVFAADDASSLHTRMTSESFQLSGCGASAYLDIDKIIEVAKLTGCDAVHPGYGFLSENHEFAQRCLDEELLFIGPTPELLKLFGDKAAARAAAKKAGVSTPQGIDHAVTIEEATGFFDQLPDGRGMFIKAISGGGGRGSRAVHERGDIEKLFHRCQSEALSAFGNGDVYVEEFIPRARHIEVQIIADKFGNVAHLGDRDCSVQRSNQKLIEIAPAPDLKPRLRANLADAAIKMAEETGYSNIGTFEFLLDLENSGFVFIETNPRLQVEHTVTEEVTGIDLVQSQILIASGARLSDLDIKPGKGRPTKGFAIQARINCEQIGSGGRIMPSSGQLSAYDPPSGPGIRVDGFAYGGYRTSGLYDSLLAKVIAFHPGGDLNLASDRLIRALSEFRIAGVDTSIPLLQGILKHDDFGTNALHTRWFEEVVVELQNTANAAPPQRFFEPSRDLEISRADHLNTRDLTSGHENIEYEVLDLGRVASPIQGKIVRIEVRGAQPVKKGQEVAIVEAMKMEHVVEAPAAGKISGVAVSVGDLVNVGDLIAAIDLDEYQEGVDQVSSIRNLDEIRPDLQENIDRHFLTLDEARPDKVKRRHYNGGRTPHENIADLIDEGSFKEYLPLVVAQQHDRFDDEALRKHSPADGVVTGSATINAGLFGEENTGVMVVHYDYSVMAGTQGIRSHHKQDRIFELAERSRFPVVLFSEGGGGRPGEDDVGPEVYFDITTFSRFSRLSGLVPLVGVNHGRCFAGNTALLAACDVIIATKSSTIAMGGPAMIEAGGFGSFTPEQVGPMSVQVPNGTVDILVEDEAEAVEVAKKYLSYFQGKVWDWTAPDQRALRHIIPENRKRPYDMRKLMALIADEGSILEIREQFGRALITVFLRIEGHTLGVIANNPLENGGAIDSDCADKGARFIQLCDAFDIPVLSLIDCPGMMVGPEVEATALVRHSVRLFNAGSNLTTPLMCVVVRKAYGLGVMAMCGGGALNGLFTVAWPSAEFAAMNIEGSVKLGYKKELEAISDIAERAEEFERLVSVAQDGARAVNAAAGGGLDDVIDPAETRSWIASHLRRVIRTPERSGKKYQFIDTW